MGAGDLGFVAEEGRVTTTGAFDSVRVATLGLVGVSLGGVCGACGEITEGFREDDDIFFCKRDKQRITKFTDSEHLN